MVLIYAARDWPISRIGTFPSRDHFAVCASKGKLYVFGGLAENSPSDANSTLNDLWVLDTETGQSKWQQLHACRDSQMPAPRSGHVMVAHRDRLWMFGGCSGERSTADFHDLWTFTLATNRWERQKPSSSGPSPRHNHAACSKDGKLYVYGGFSDGKTLCDLWCLNLDNLWWECVFSEDQASHAPCPAGAGVAAMAVHDRGVYVHGGEGPHGITGEFWAFILRKGKWQHLPPIEEKEQMTRWRHQAAVCDGNRLTIIGGTNDRLKLMKDLHEFDFLSQSWTQTQCPLPAVTNFRIAPMGPSNRFFVVCGLDETGTNCSLFEVAYGFPGDIPAGFHAAGEVAEQPSQPRTEDDDPPLIQQRSHDVSLWDPNAFTYKPSLPTSASSSQRRYQSEFMTDEQMLLEQEIKLLRKEYMSAYNEAKHLRKENQELKDECFALRQAYNEAVEATRRRR